MLKFKEMKKIIKFLPILLILILASCAKKIYTSPEVVSQLINSDEFTFMAERANPNNSDVINIMNSLPRAGSGQFLNLDYGYTITLKNKKLMVDLPYFGRLYTPSTDPDKNSFNFSTSDYTLKKSQNKKGNWLYTINTRNDATSITFLIEIFPNGKAYVYVNSTDRQSISYDGYVMKNKTENTK